MGELRGRQREDHYNRGQENFYIKSPWQMHKRNSFYRKARVHLVRDLSFTDPLSPYFFIAFTAVLTKSILGYFME